MTGRLFICVVGFVVTVSLSSEVSGDDDVPFMKLSLTDGTVLCSVDEPSKIVSLAESDVVSSSDSCASAAAKCAWICSRDIQCTSFNYDATSASCKLFYYVPLNYSSAKYCTHFRMNVVSETCPQSQDGVGAGSSPPVIKMISPQCCSLPFTYSGRLYVQCAQNVSNSADVGCFTLNRTWVSCLPPTGFSVAYRVSNISVPNFVQAFLLTTVNNWIVIQQRLDAFPFFNGSWVDYKNGFGAIADNFWLGLEKVYQMTNAASYRLRIEVESLADGKWYSSEYDTFVLDSEAADYTIHVEGYSGDGSDAFNFYGLNQNGKVAQLHNGRGFTTFDADHDRLEPGNCASLYGNAGFWYDSCLYICLTCSTASAKFIWRIQAGDVTLATYSLRSYRMMIKLP